MYMYVFRIEYVSYRQGPYRIRIDTADDRIVPALVLTLSYKSKTTCIVRKYMHPKNLVLVIVLLEL